METFEFGCWNSTHDESEQLCDEFQAISKLIDSEPELSQDLDYLYSLQASDKLLPIIQAASSSPFLKITTHGDLVYLLHSHSHFSADHFGNPDFI